MSTEAENMKVTYTSTNVDLSRFHAWFDEALRTLRAQQGATYPAYIDGVEVRSEQAPIEDRSPIDAEVVLGHFQACTKAHVDQAVAAARRAQKSWRKLAWQERVAIMRRAAGLIRKQKFEIAGVMCLEVGKNRLEAMGDAEESADLIDYYCDQVEQADGFVRSMKKMTTIETNTDVLRPFGVFVCISPFNFPMALSTGMSSAALVAGNAVIFKPASTTPWTGYRLYKIYEEAGVPAGVFNFITGRGCDVGDTLTFHEGVDGVVFTGSKDVGMRIFHGLSERWAKPCLMELGGKNPAIVTASADLDKASDGVMKSAWGLQNQKCSACSRVYVHKAVAADFIERLIAKTKAISIGDPCDADVYFGPVINEAAVKTYLRVVDQAKAEGEILYGGHRLTEGALAKGHYVAPAIVRVSKESTLLREEFFVPFLAVCEVDSLEEAIEESNKAEYGLTAGLYSGDEAEIELFFDEIESGVTYINKRSGATTGAWPGAQPFCGWKGSGGSGKGGCGPYYVAQFMREQSRSVVVEK